MLYFLLTHQFLLVQNPRHGSRSFIFLFLVSHQQNLHHGVHGRRQNEKYIFSCSECSICLHGSVRLLILFFLRFLLSCCAETLDVIFACSLLDEAEKRIAENDQKQIVDKSVPSPASFSPATLSTLSRTPVRAHVFRTCYGDDDAFTTIYNLVQCYGAFLHSSTFFFGWRVDFSDLQQGLGVVPPVPSPTEPNVTLQSELQVARHILQLKELLRANQSQLSAGMGAAGLLKSGMQQSFSASPNFNFPVVPTQVFTPIASRPSPIVQLAAPFTHNSDGTRYLEETIVSVPSRSNSYEAPKNSDAVSPTFVASGFVRRQA